MRIRDALRRTCGCVLAVMIVLAPTSGALAGDVRVRCGGSAAYRGSDPDAMAREAALHAAKVDCVSVYVELLTDKLHPLPVEYRDYFELAWHPELQGRLDEYISDVNIESERTDEAEKRYTIIVTATLNEERFRATLAFPRQQ